ncbi:hypothetical protein [Nostoc sphaeroides]|uniref:hypothetical protein n=1 Tax=Nostoc sphaeroides TaxID=446679 RepID=UPI00126A31CB|nr:hypothetical protein [Nostoc sphaeroides]
MGFQKGNFIPPYKGDLVPSELCGDHEPNKPKKRNEINRKAFEKGGDYPLTRNLFVIIKDFQLENNLDEKAGRAYANLMLTGKGQAIIQKAGFIPIGYACPLR